MIDRLPPPLLPNLNFSLSEVQQGSPHVLILGGGLMALALALELRWRGARVTVLSRDRRAAAGYAAAGMLAPQAEKLSGAMQQLCLRSRELYPAWVAQLESITGESAGYWSCGILNPLYHLPENPKPSDLQSQAETFQSAISQSTIAPSALTDPPTPVEWLDYDAIRQRQPGLGEAVVGGWWFPKDAQVDNRRQLLRSLERAIAQVGVDWQEGVTVTAIVPGGQERVRAIATDQGEFQADHYVLAAGAWSSQLLDLPVFPRKGQMLSIQADPAQPPLGQVLYGDGIYLVPRRDGVIVIGATAEDVDFAPGNTLAGMHQLLADALDLLPGLRHCPILETWWGYRPATPDEWPILGPSAFRNLSLATGHYRNGVLLAPITAQLLADWILQQKTDPLLAAFRWDRF